MWSGLSDVRQSASWQRSRSGEPLLGRDVADALMGCGLEVEVRGKVLGGH